MSELKIRISAITNQAFRPNNEDNYVVCHDLSQAEWTQNDSFAELGPLGSLLVVADGMGGANAGEVASAIAIDTMRQLFAPDNLDAVKNDDNQIQKFMKQAVTIADDAILKESKADSKKSGMGTTIVMAWILGHRAYVCWCGDSRCYLYRPAQNALYRVSHDHSYVQELVDHGELHPDLAFEHPMSNVITRCLGNADGKAQAETIICELQPGDILLLCTDGLCGLCRDTQIGQVLKEQMDDIDKCRDQLITSALDAGGHDNVTVALATFQAARKEETEQGDTQSAVAGDEEAKSEEEDLKKTLKNDKQKPVSPASVKEKKKKSKIKWKWIFFTLLLLALAGGLYFFNKPTTQDVTPPLPPDNNQLVTDSVTTQHQVVEEEQEEENDLLLEDDDIRQNETAPTQDEQKKETDTSQKKNATAAPDDVTGKSKAEAKEEPKAEMTEEQKAGVAEEQKAGVTERKAGAKQESNQ